MTETNLRFIRNLALIVLQKAAKLGVNLTIENQPLVPLSTGNTQPKVEVWPKRNWVEPATPENPFWFVAKSLFELEAFYRSLIPALTEAGRNCGYAISVHGSLRRDFDLVATPWVETASSPELLVRSLSLAASGFQRPTYEFEEKPLGRLAVSFPVCMVENMPVVPGIGHIDLSIIPPTPRPA